jgi:hypothetical protein
VSDIPRASISPQETKPQATKILLVEESLANRDIQTGRLQRRGFLVCNAADALYTPEIDTDRHCAGGNRGSVYKFWSSELGDV